MAQMAAKVCTEQFPSTSFANVPPVRSYFSSQGHSKAINNQEPYFAINSLPPEIHLRILENLPRSDIDNCSLVCRRWNAQISRNAHLLPKHFIKSLAISENKSCFTLEIDCLDFTKRWAYEHVKNDIKPRQVEKRRRDADECPDAPPAKIANIFCYLDPSFHLTVPCPEFVREYTLHKKAIHTPPVELVARLLKCFRHADVGNLELEEFRFTDCFVDLLSCAFENMKIKCKALYVRFCKLKYISPESFERFMRLLDTEYFHLSWIRENRRHLTSAVVMKMLSERSKLLDISSVTPETLMYGDDFLENFIDNSKQWKILRLDECAVTANGLRNAVKKWKESKNVVFKHICVSVDSIQWSRFVESQFHRLPKTGDKLQIPHPTLCNTVLDMWNDYFGVHLVHNVDY